MIPGRSCEGCTKCCEGVLQGEALGRSFYAGKPCHFVAIGQGCAVYAERPEDPCIAYECAWRRDETLPMWMKPSEVGAIVDWRQTSLAGARYLEIHEAGQRLDSAVLTWMIEYALTAGINLIWTVEGGKHYIGSPDFVAEIEASA